MKDYAIKNAHPNEKLIRRHPKNVILKTLPLKYFWPFPLLITFRGLATLIVHLTNALILNPVDRFIK